MTLLRGILLDELPVYLARMSAANLNSKLSVSGPGAMISEISSGVADRALTYVKTHQDLFTISVDPIQPQVDEYTPYVDKAASAPATFPDTSSHGAAYYFGMLVFPDK